MRKTELLEIGCLEATKKMLKFSKVAGHRVLAINRGEKEKILTVKISAPEEDILRYLEKQVITKENENEEV